MYLPKEKAFLEEVTVVAFSFDPNQAQLDKDLNKIINRKKDLSWLGEEYQKILMPALPCFDLVFVAEGETKTGMLKREGGKEALASGKRSAILEENGKHLRLKGCGNLYLGFNLQEMGYPEGFFEIRGCCFENTVVREQFMTWFINEKLKESGFFTGNTPKEFWKYQESGYDKIDKFCGVFFTHGEKRLGSHLIVGLEKMVINTVKISENSLISLVPENRRSNYSTVKLISQSGPLNQSIHEWTSLRVYKEDDRFINALENNDLIFLEEEVFIGDTRLTNKDLFLKICLVSFRIGWEVGKVKRALQDNDISWGYFIDHNPFEPHCNAHCNNFIVLGNGEHNLLAPVDFDMAFRKEEFISLMEDENFARFDEALFENWVNCERINLELTLAGQENMANFKYSEGSFHLAVILLRDLMVLGFRDGFENREFKYEWDRKKVEYIVRESLELTSEVVEY